MENSTGLRTIRIAELQSDYESPIGEVRLTDQDVFEVMKSISGYLDITPGDFMELQCHAHRHAVERIARSVLARDMMTRGFWA